MPSILLIRHAQASFGAEDYDVLSEHGRAQTAALVEGLRRRGIAATRVISGDLRRQQDTAGPCAADRAVELEIDARWNEYDDRDILAHHAPIAAGLEHHPGDRELTSRDFQAVLNEALTKWIAAGAAGPCDETFPQFQQRLRGALSELASGLGKGETALVVSSGGAIAALSAGLLRVAPEAMIAFNHVSVNAGISKLTVGRGGVTLISTNEHAHLEQAERSLVSYR